MAYATSTLARYLIAPREGHLVAMKRVFNPKPFKHHKTPPDNETWKEYYPDAEEEKPLDQPEPEPLKAQITINVDADHAQDTVT